MPQNPRKVENRISKQESETAFRDRLIYFGACSAGISYLILWINTFYFNLPVSSIISYVPIDLWCPSENSGIGIHCFGDYQTPVVALHLENAWDGDGYAYTPFASKLFLPFDQLSRLFDEPRVGLFTYLILGAVCMLMPLLWAGKTTKGFSPMFAVIFGLMGTPLISAFDRGSVVMFITPWLFYYAYSVIRKDWNAASISIIILVVLKPQYLVLLLPLLIYREWSYLFSSILKSLLITAFGFFVFTPNPLTVFQQWFKFAYNYNQIGNSQELNLYNVSLIETLKIPIDNFLLPFFRLRWDIPDVSVMNLGLIFGICLILPLICLGSRVSLLGATIVSLATASLIIPVSNFYYQNFCIVLVALILKHPNRGEESDHGVLDRIEANGYMSRISKYLLVAATINSCFNLPISINSFAFLREPFGRHASISRIVVAPLWLLLIGSINIDSIKNFRQERSGLNL